MILSDIGRYVQAHHQVTLNQIAVHFNAQPDAVRGMLEIWVNKGKISRQMATTSCGSTCQQCDTALTEIYIWGATTGGLYVDRCFNN
jgi:hypothetical protein